MAFPSSNPVERNRLAHLWADRQYTVTVLLGNPSATPPWCWHTWQNLASVIDPLVRAARPTPAVRSWQCDSLTGAEVRFGRIGWNTKGHMKWAHASPANAPASATWHFENVELWAPSWHQAVREGIPPDVLLQVQDQHTWLWPGNALTFNPTVLLAIANDLPANVSIHVTNALTGFRSALMPLLAARQVLPWANIFSAEGMAYINSIDDLLPRRLFRSHAPHDTPVSTFILKDGWAPTDDGNRA